MNEAPHLSEEILAELAHELNTPISVIAGYAELVAQRSAEPSSREAAVHIGEAAARLRATVERLLAEAREA